MKKHLVFDILFVAVMLGALIFDDSQAQLSFSDSNSAEQIEADSLSKTETLKDQEFEKDQLAKKIRMIEEKKTLKLKSFTETLEIPKPTLEISSAVILSIF